MKQRVNFKTIYLIATITVGLLGLAIGSTYAIFTSSAEINNPISLSTTLTSDDDVFDVIDIVIEPYDTITKTIKIVNSSNSTVNFAIWYLNNFSDNSVDFGINDVPSGTLNVSSNESRIVNIRNKTSNQITITIGVASSKKSITLADSMVIYPNQTLPENIINQQAAKYITNLYKTSAKTTVTNNSINYNYAISKSLMNDRKGSSSIEIDNGNIRYYGATPNNYVYFNCNSYNSQNSSSCEKWRIIGVFDGKLKIVRSASIGNYSWDTSLSTNNSGYGYTKWDDSYLMFTLNKGYKTAFNNNYYGSLYHDKGSGICFNGQSLANTSCNFTSTGIKNLETQNMISSTNWNLGGWNSRAVYPNQIYNYERGTTVYSGHPTLWQGKIALPYPSDYAYAASFGNGTSTLCNSTINNYSSTNCKNNNWMYSLINSKKVWLLTPYSGNSYDPFLLDTNGNATYGAVSYNANAVYPTLYLNPDVVIAKGTGTSSDPYKLQHYDYVDGEYFNGYTEYKNADFANYPFEKNITVVAKFKIDDYPTKFSDIIANWENGGFGLVIDSDKKVKFGVHTSTDSGYIYASSNSTVTLNKMHIAVGTYDGTTIKIYLDGKLVGSTTSSGTIKTSPAQIAIGADPYTDGTAKGEFFPGYVYHAEVFPITLSANTISSYYDGKHYGYYNDSSKLVELNGKKGILTKDTTYRGKYFDGSSVTINKGFANESLGSKLTIITRFKIQEFPADYMEIVANTESAGFDIYVDYDKTVYFDLLTNNSSSYSTITTLPSSLLSTNTWYTVVGTYDGTTQKLYFNGKLVASKSLTGAIKPSVTPIIIGADPGSSGGVSNLFKGVISDVIVIKDVLSESTISSNYAKNVDYVTNANTIIKEIW